MPVEGAPPCVCDESELIAKAEGEAIVIATIELNTRIVFAAMVTSRCGVSAELLSALIEVRKAESGHPCDKGGGILAEVCKFSCKEGLPNSCGRTT